MKSMYASDDTMWFRHLSEAFSERSWGDVFSTASSSRHFFLPSCSSARALRSKSSDPAELCYGLSAGAVHVQRSHNIRNMVPPM
eukprot:6041781-Amphidinium_carterae.1